MLREMNQVKERTSVFVSSCFLFKPKFNLLLADQIIFLCFIVAHQSLTIFRLLSNVNSTNAFSSKDAKTPLT